MINHITKLLKLYPNKPWNWYQLSKNKNITWAYVQKNPNKPWDWRGLSRNPNITWKIVSSNLDKPWDWYKLSKNKNITWEIIHENPSRVWSWANPMCIYFAICWSNKTTNAENIIKNYERKWVWHGFVKNPNMKLEHVKKLFNNPSRLLNLMSINSLTKHKCFTLENFIEHDVFQHCTRGGFSQNPNVTFDTINENEYIDWNWESLSMNVNITEDIIRKNPRKSWSWKYISLNPNITWEFIQDNENKNWHWKYLSFHPNITWDIIKENLGLFNCDWKHISKNPNLSWEIIHENPGRWDWESISANTFDQPALPAVCYL